MRGTQLSRTSWQKDGLEEEGLLHFQKKPVLEEEVSIRQQMPSSLRSTSRDSSCETPSSQLLVQKRPRHVEEGRVSEEEHRRGLRD